MEVEAESFEQQLMQLGCTKTRFLVADVGAVWKTPMGIEFTVPYPNGPTYSQEIVTDIIKWLDVPHPGAVGLN